MLRNTQKKNSCMLSSQDIKIDLYMGIDDAEKISIGTNFFSD